MLPRFVFLMRFLPRRFSRAALWIGTTSFMILVLPVVFETEKLQMEQQQQLQQRQVRLKRHRLPSLQFGCSSGCLLSPAVISWCCGSGSRSKGDVFDAVGSLIPQCALIASWGSSMRQLPLGLHSCIQPHGSGLGKVKL